ncbi:SDR family NAD(P)-dependent oxidoreductase [Williamsia serinedens]|uniref:Short-chain dehydrogenase n=1 Tax=Williamsia serinedens TaxID=391736 RepID=A0ABT1GWK7_9NOCA|nr:SDR family NAD(P)-dependent oxidoreductase [Williamsia serinedens]MCP2159366.1 Short-chain dehydrogenase [Williamsia serinedens]
MERTTSRTVLITGASRGIGERTALRFAESGARLVVVARGRAALEDVADRCRIAGAPDVLVLPADIGDPDAVRGVFDAALDRFGHLDVVVQNASVAAFGRFTDIPAHVFDAVLRVNVLGAASVCREALQHFRERGRGSLVVVGSLLGHAAVPLMSPYVMSKFAVTALVRILRQETRADRDITMHGIWPGAVDTAIYPLSANYSGRLARVLPLNDPPDKMARAIVDISSRRSRDRQVGLANRPMLLGYRLLPWAFDVMVRPMMGVLSFTRDRLDPTPGNVEAPTDVPAVARGHAPR